MYCLYNLTLFFKKCIKILICLKYPYLCPKSISQQKPIRIYKSYQKSKWNEVTQTLCQHCTCKCHRKSEFNNKVFTWSGVIIELCNFFSEFTELWVHTYSFFLSNFILIPSTTFESKFNHCFQLSSVSCDFSFSVFIQSKKKRTKKLCLHLFELSKILLNLRYPTLNNNNNG